MPIFHLSRSSPARPRLASRRIVAQVGLFEGDCQSKCNDASDTRGILSNNKLYRRCDIRGFTWFFVMESSGKRGPLERNKRPGTEFDIDMMVMGNEQAWRISDGKGYCKARADKDGDNKRQRQAGRNCGEVRFNVRYLPRITHHSFIPLFSCRSGEMRACLPS